MATMNVRSAAITSVALVTCGALLGLWWWQRQPAETAPAPPAPRSVTGGVPSAPSAPSVPSRAYPIEAVASAASQPVAEPWTLANVADRLVGRATALKWLQTDDLARRVVATVDQLGREQASSRLWPANPAPDRFKVREQDGRSVIDPDNATRYVAHLKLLESIDPATLTVAYVQLYPELQRAYEELGHRGAFNDRLVQVIDGLLATPEIDTPLAVHMPTHNSPVQPARPWVLYELSDPALATLAAGQKLLLRLGPAHERRVKQWLRAWRRHLAPGAAAR